MVRARAQCCGDHLAGRCPWRPREDPAEWAGGVLAPLTAEYGCITLCLRPQFSWLRSGWGGYKDGVRQ